MKPDRFLALGLLIFLGVTGLRAQVTPVELQLPQALFTNPDRFQEGGKDETLVRVIEDLIAATPSGEEISVCVFKFERESLAQALLAAEDRGVKVRVILNKGKTSKETNLEVKELYEESLDDFHYLNNDISKKGIIHNKFILFSAIETTQGRVNNVVLQTSSNFQKKGTKKLQDMVLLSSRAIYYAYLDFWYDIKVLGNVGQLDEFNHFKASDDEVEVYFFPKRKDGEESGADNVVKALEEIEDAANTEIRFAHGKWSENRADVIAVLKDLQKNGAKVQVVSNRDVEVSKELDELEEGVMLLSDEYNLHTKFFLLREGERKEVWTGSHNLTDRSLYENFEVIMSLSQSEIYDAYLQYFQKLVKLID